MNIAVTLRTEIELSDIEDINEAYEIVAGEMSPNEILELAVNQGNTVNVDLEEY